MTNEQPDGDEGTVTVRVVAAVVFDDEKVLACRRKPDKAAGGLWEFPGGKIESGESPQEALVREIREELGTTVLVDSELSTDTTVVDGLAIQLACFRTSLAGPKPEQSLDHDQLLWIPLSDLGRLEWARPDLPAVRRLVDSVRS
ncbi:(deoxy)nucleoside triphosphate pyrophosphohydrolase [Nesterenkonia muleiensis]|uniref:(deoxy)nucleoside triphosphate pyrophosphohydrolase n=1 Tax=Nesterenkonia muleiensis TaxID=2282648 RepID=UPI001EE4C57C|nr:(deoxy)nucleoside triphosphate pyrophosphohydrolase [Nesterenkonia muleiensis]